MKPTLLPASLLSLTLLAGCASEPPKATTPPPASGRLPRDAEVEAYVSGVREQLSKGKESIFNDVMHLSDSEAKIFWPIYKKYESELYDAGDQRVDLIRRIDAAMHDGKLAQVDAADLTDRYLKFEQQRLDLVKKYQAIISKDLSPVRAAQFVQVEHRVAIILDLTIAAGVPVLEGRAK